MFILAKEKSIANNILAELRDEKIQKDRMKFRSNMEKLGSLLAYEISKTMDFRDFQIKTPMGLDKSSVLSAYPDLICVLRAGIPFFQGFLHIFDKSNCGFLGAQRANQGNKDEIEIEAGYFTSPDLKEREVIIVDPMLATGKSFVKAAKGIMEKFKPKKIHVASLLASRDGINYINENIDATIWTIDLDEELNELAYIVPGLGDAGDLSYGIKV